MAADFSLSGLINKYIEDLFEAKKVSAENREKLWSYYYDKLAAAVDIGFNPKSVFWDEPLATALKKNIAEFSAFKETSFRKTLEELLTTDGKLTPKKEFLQEAYRVSGDYNHRWLQAEYHQTIANAQSAEKWKDFQQNRDLYPNLKLTTVRDARVRPEHKVLDGIIKPIDHPFWNTHLPPLDWGCRCDVEQTDEDETGDVKGGLQLKIEFENNPGKSGKIFNGSAYEKNLSEDERLKTIRIAEFSEYKKNKNYTDVQLHDNLGLQATHTQHKFDKILGHYEKEVQDFFAKRGDKFILEKEANDKKYFEGFLNDQSCEIKSITGNSAATIRKRIAQIAEKKAEIGIIYFPEKYSKTNLRKALRDYDGKMPKLIVLHKDKIIKDGR